MSLLRKSLDLQGSAYVCDPVEVWLLVLGSGIEQFTLTVQGSPIDSTLSCGT